MLCQKCHKNLATVRYAEVVDGKVTDQHLCPDCLTRIQEGVTGFELAGAAPTPKRHAQMREPDDVSPPSLVCRACGLELRTALKTGRVGCRSCYSHFGEPLDEAIRGIHGALRHRGKMPRVDSARDRIRTSLQTKRALLRSSLKAEQYEQAALLRDEIRSLEEGLDAQASGHD